LAHNEAVAAPLLDRADPPRAELVPFLPRLTLQWLRDHPERTWVELEGTLAFIDISGFTALSERLSGLGKAGAEVLTDVIDSTFAPLLEVAYDCGGGLLKFGGDALLLLFSGDDHAPRAARATFEMRELLRKIGRVRTPAGSTTLNMHAGIHTGRFYFFLVGDTHRELLVTGPGATATVDMEGGSEAGEILISPAVAKTLDPACVGAPRGAGFLLQAMPQVVGALEPLPDPAGVALEQALPAALRAQLLEVGPLEGEHRQCAVAFIRYQALDGLLECEGPKATTNTLDELVRIVQRASDDHDVTFLQSDIDRDGGKIILVAGAPQTRGDNEERLLRTVRAIVDASPPLPLHIGVSRGRIFAGQVGFTFRRTYTVMGDTVSLAARLMGRAGVGEILVAAEAFDRSNGRFEADELEPFAVKGVSVPVRAFALGALRDASATEEETRLPFIGRRRELELLAASAASARNGVGALVELVGEAGIGKSRLAEELRSDCPDMVTLAARCEQYESTTPYHPFRPLLRSLLEVDLNGSAAHNRELLSERLAAIDDELVPWAPLLAAPLDIEVESTREVDDLDPAFVRTRLHAFVSELLGRLLDSPTLLLFEDVHWMDDASSELLRYLGAQLSTRPWLTCTTRRSVEGGFAAAEGKPQLPALTLELEPLEPDDARALVEAAAGERTLSIEAARALAARGAGNPLFLQELASADIDADELPESVEALLAARIDGLGPGERTLLRWASVFGNAFTGSLVAEVLSDEQSVPPGFDVRLGEFVERDPEAPDGFRFRHTLVRDVAYEGLSFKRRRELHGRAADAIERRHAANPAEAAELLSLHFLRAGRWPQAWRHSLEAGRRAQEKWANVEAAEFYRRALESARHLRHVEPAEVAAVWEALGDCLRLSGNLADAATAFREARRRTPDGTPEQIELMHKEGKIREDLGKYSEAIRWYTRGAKTADRIEDEALRTHLRLELSMGYAQARFRQGAFDDCIRRCKEVVEQSLAVDDLTQLGRAYLLIYIAYLALGSPERAAFRGLALPIFEELGDLRRQATTLNNLGIEAYYEGDWDKALDVYERARELFERIGDVTSVAMATNNIGEIYSDQGRLEEAGELFASVRRAAVAAGHRLWSAIALLNLGRAAARAGRFDEAESQLAEAADAFRELQARSYMLETDLRIAEADVLRGGRAASALAAAEAILEDTRSAADISVRAIALRLKGSSLLQLGRRDDAVAAFAESVRAAEQAGVVYEQALALAGLASASGDAEPATESRRLLARLRVESVARPSLN
jgi:class 3 adenylate cyclase/tetratricopeptide (TPR) repeat protein